MDLQTPVQEESAQACSFLLICAGDGWVIKRERSEKMGIEIEGGKSAAYP